VGTSHLVREAADFGWDPIGGPLAGASGVTICSLVGPASPAVHTGFGLARIEPGGRLPAHVHSYEESVYVLAGEVVIQTADVAARLGPGDYGWIPVGVAHSLRNVGERRTEFVRMSAPAPRPEHAMDTYVVPELADTAPVRPDPRDPRTRRYGHIDPAHSDPARQSQEHLAQSASMRTALLVYSGITVKPMIDSDLGAVLSTMFMVQYQPDGVAGAHDHPFEESYLILEGSVVATFDGTEHLLGPGDVAWAGVGCVHGFRNAGDVPVRWLETQAPQPPARHSYRFARDWQYLAARVAEGTAGEQRGGSAGGGGGQT
jgi:quercetin dioxygenase-like cupin family protein